MNPLKILKNKLFGDKANNSSPIGKIIGVKGKMVKYGIIAGIASFAILIMAVLGIVSYFLGFVQVNVERFTNTVRGGCILCTNEDLEKIKEKQFQSKINLIGSVLKKKVDKAVLASTVLFQGDYYSIIDATYDKDYNEKSFVKKVTEFADSLSVTGDNGYKGVEQREIDLIDAVTIIMVNSNVDGKYNEESYKKALVSAGYGGGDDFGGWVTNGVSCATNTLFQTAKGVWNSIPFVSVLFNTGNTVDGLVAVADSVNICKYGFIEGTFDNVHNIKDEATKELKKKKIAQEIIDFAKFYRELFPEEEDECSYAGSAGSGEITNWRQCDERWGSTVISSSTVCQIGCTTTALSYLIAKSGTQLAVPEINPGIYAQHKSGYDGDLINWNYSEIAPNLHNNYDSWGINVNTSNYAEKISEIINTPYNGKQQFVLVKATGGGGAGEHWAAVDHVENGVVYVLDPSSSEEGLTDVTTMHRWGLGEISLYALYADDVDFGKTGSSSGTSSSEANSKVESYLSEMKKIADDDSHGYSMEARNGPDYDCSSFIYYSLVNAGILSGNDPFVTTNMGEVLKEAGFTEIAYSKDSLQKGDIVVDTREGASGHTTTIYSVDGSDIKQIAAHKNLDGVSGDSSGNEIDVSDYSETGHQYTYIYRLSGANSSCDSGTGSSEDFLEFLAMVEGVTYCNYNGQGEESGYGTENLNDGAGVTTSYGITENYDADVAREVGYSSFISDMHSGCTSKEYIDKMVLKVIDNNKDAVLSEASDKGITGLSDSQIYALLSVRYNTGPSGGYSNIMNKIAAYGVDSYETFECFRSNSCSWRVSGYDDGLVRRRMAEYELFITGNFNAAKPSESYSYFSSIDNKNKLEEYEKSNWPTSR